MIDLWMQIIVDFIIHKSFRIFADEKKFRDIWFPNEQCFLKSQLIDLLTVLKLNRLISSITRLVASPADYAVASPADSSYARTRT